MLNPKYQRYADRLGELIEEGRRVAKKTSVHSSQVTAWEELHTFLSKVENLLTVAFGPDSAQVKHYRAIGRASYAHSVNSVVGLLVGAKDDLENGFLTGQEFLIASEVFDSVLEQAKYLNSKGYKDPAAVLARVVLEDALKRLAREEGIPFDAKTKATVLNDGLKKAEKYAQPQWRLIQAWLDIGNSAAHGDFHEYTQEEVGKLIEDIERFLATYFTA